MYSQPWSPTPSTTAVAPELRTAKRSPGHAVEEGLAAGGAVEHDVADEDVLLRQEGGRCAAGRRSACRRRGPCRRSRWRRLRASSVTPVARNAPKLCPAEPVKWKLDGVVGQARRSRSARAISPLSIAPTVRWTLRMGSLISTGVPVLDGLARRDRSACSRAPARGRDPAAARSGARRGSGTCGL